MKSSSAAWARRVLNTVLLKACTLVMAAVSMINPVMAQAQTPLMPLIASEGSTWSPPWRVVGLPKAKTDITLTRFEVGTVQGERALKVSTQSSYGTLVHDLPQSTAGKLQWRWRLDQPLTGGKAVADLLTKTGDDAALKVCVLFEQPLERVPFLERSLLRLARSVSGENLPAATICYVWDSLHPAGLQGANPYTQRVRFITLQGKGAVLGQWQNELRDVAADFAMLFADELPTGSKVPKVRAVLIGADSDNTGSHSVAWVKSIDWLQP
jgi:Protein of unknown function (DUF3047)